MGARRIVVEADGGSRGNPGVAGYGALLRDARTGRVLAELAAPLGRVSNNVAEYCGLIAGLEAVLEVEPSADVEVRMDSKLVVEQMTGRWRIKHEDMRRLALQARDLGARIGAGGGSVSYTWVPREQNGPADELSNDGMDGMTVGRFHHQAAQAVADPAGGAMAGGTVADRAAAGGPAPTRTRGLRLLLVRSAVADPTRSGGLDAEGRRQAAATAAEVRSLVGSDLVSLLSSSLPGSVATAAVIAGVLGVVPRVDPAWDEEGFGDRDGTLPGDLGAAAPEEASRLRENPAYQRPGGESLEELQVRVLAALAGLVAGAGTVVLVTSRRPIRIVLGHLLQIPPERFRAITIEPCSLTGVRITEEGHVAVSFTNRTHHLG